MSQFIHFFTMIARFLLLRSDAHSHAWAARSNCHWETIRSYGGRDSGVNHLVSKMVFISVFKGAILAQSRPDVLFPLTTLFPSRRP
jgi:hypothetical protein